MAQALELHHETQASSAYPLLLMVLCPLLLIMAIRSATATTTSTSAGKLLNKLPSPPWKLPVIGHLLHLASSLPHIALRDLAGKHGRDGLILLHLGTVPTIIVSSPRAAQAVLRTNDLVFASRPYSVVTDILFYGSSDVAFSPYGEYWRQVKKIVTTHLLTAKKVRSYSQARQQEVINMRKTIEWLSCSFPLPKCCCFLPLVLPLAPVHRSLPPQHRHPFTLLRCQIWFPSYGFTLPL